MKILVYAGSNDIVFDSQHISAIIEALGTAKLYEHDYGYDTDAPLKAAGTKEKPEMLKIALINESRLQEADPIMKKTMEELAISKQNWLKEYSENGKLKNEIKELKEKIENINSATKAE